MATKNMEILEKLQVKSLTSGATYDITIYVDGRWTCSCPHWIHRCKRLGKDCKHIIGEKLRRAEKFSSFCDSQEQDDGMERATCVICYNDFPLDDLHSIGEIGDGNVACRYCEDERKCSFKAKNCPQYKLGFCTDKQLVKSCPHI